MAPWIIGFLPDHDSYIEPYGGSAAVLLRKPRSPIEVYNDLDGDVVTFFRILRQQPEELIRAIYWTPYAYGEQQLSLEPTDDELEQARRIYIRSHLTISGPTAQWNSGWRRQKVYSRGRAGNSRMKTAAMSFMEVEHLYQIAERLRGVTIESMDALALIAKYDNPRAAFYVDPPYVASSRTRWNASAYQHEMTDDQHRELAAVLHACAGAVLLSGYDCELYQELYIGWPRHTRDVRTNGNTDRMATETLWLNPTAAQALDRGQLSLWRDQ
jgi:DNA adenine methylase